MKKTLISLTAACLLTSTLYAAGDGWNSRKSSSNFNYQVQENNFQNWVEKNTRPKKFFGIGYNEEGLGISFGVNTNFNIYDTEETNFYSIIEYTDNRILISEAYDVMNNLGVSGFQLMPFIGLSVDTSSTKIGYFAGIRSRYSFKENLGLSVGYKYYFEKPVKDSGDDDKDKKDYFFTLLEYQF